MKLRSQAVRAVRWHRCRVRSPALSAGTTAAPCRRPHERCGKFKDDRSLTSDQIDTIVKWVDGGAPKGRDADLPPAPTFAAGWSRGQPDVVIEMPVDFEIPAEGQVPVIDFFTRSPFTQDVYIKALVYYELETPKKIPAGSKVTVVTLFDNSTGNKYNPAPEKEVFWSEQSWDEMYAPQARITVDSRELKKGTAIVRSKQ